MFDGGTQGEKSNLAQSFLAVLVIGDTARSRFGEEAD